MMASSLLLAHTSHQFLGSATVACFLRETPLRPWPEPSHRTQECESNSPEDAHENARSRWLAIRVSRDIVPEERAPDVPEISDLILVARLMTDSARKTRTVAINSFRHYILVS